MKKPNYIEIRLPGRKSTFSAARKKYFKRLEDKVLEVNFGRDRERKIFEYVVIDSGFYEGWSSSPGGQITYWYLRLELKVPREDPDKVL